jgi:hypothetical protein
VTLRVFEVFVYRRRTGIEIMGCACAVRKAQLNAEWKIRVCHVRARIPTSEVLSGFSLNRFQQFYTEQRVASFVFVSFDACA